MGRRFTLKLDTKKTGIDAVFKPWQYEAVNLLLEAHEDHSSSEMLFRLKNKGHEISRASVIHFLYALSEIGLVTRREQSSRGGFKGLYKIAENRHEFNEKIINIFGRKMHEAFPDNEWLKDIWEEERT